MLTYGSCCIGRILLRIACSDTMLRAAAPQNRGGSNAALALVGDFKTFDTTSVQKVDVSRLRLPPEIGAATRAHESTSQASCPNWPRVGSETKHTLCLPESSAFIVSSEPEHKRVSGLSAEKGDAKALVKALINEARTVVRHCRHAMPPPDIAPCKCNAYAHGMLASCCGLEFYATARSTSADRLNFE